MPNPQTVYLNAETIPVGAHSLLAAVAPVSYSAELVALAAKPVAQRTNADILRIAQLVHEAFEALDWKNCGALDDGKLEGENKVATREHHNVADKKTIVDYIPKYNAKMFETMNPVVEPILACGIKTFVNVPGNAVADAPFIIPSGFTFGKVYKIPFQNANKTAPVVTSLALTSGTDYTIHPGDDGEFSISLIQGTNLLNNTSAVEFAVDYTPTAYRLVAEGGQSELTYISIKVLMKDTKGKFRWWIIPKCVSTKGFQIESKKYNDEKPDIGSDVEITGELDTRLPIGFQGAWRHDEVDVA